MPTDATFRLSTYLALALACVSVGYAEYPLLPEVGGIAVVVVIALAVLYRLETRLELLSLSAANRVGIGVALVYLGWVAVRIVREVRSPELVKTEWQLLLVALFGPLLMVLMPAKLARREKHAGDYWGLHAAGLAAVSLAGAMAEDPVCFLLIGAYAISAVWSLVVFYLHRASGLVPPVPNRQKTIPVAGVVQAPRHRTGLALGLVLLLLSVAVAVPLYLLTPRSPGGKLDFGKPRVEIGYAADQMTDLNETGELKANPQIAFEVRAEVDGQPKTDLPDDIHWRGRILRQYAGGRWLPGGMRRPTIDLATRSVFPWVAPDLGPGQCSLWLTIPARLGSQFVAEPLTWVGGQTPPIASVTPQGLRGWHWVGDGSFVWSNTTENPPDPLSYVQVWRPMEVDRSPFFRLADRDTGETFRALMVNPVARVKEYADNLVDELIRKGELPKDCRHPLRQLPLPQFHDAIARAFTKHLATTPDLRYSTTLRRSRKDIDPVEDFLFHTRSGHCERFATALTLMLRSQGIPAVLVMGFRGCEATEEPGHYVVRQEFAHEWVEALLPVYVPDGNTLKPTGLWCWRSFDPTPSGDLQNEGEAELGWFGQLRAWLSTRFAEYIGNYTPEQRRRALQTAVRWATSPVGLGVLGLGVGVWMARLVLRRRRAAVADIRSAAAAWFEQLLAVLASHGHALAPGETPREFAARVTAALRDVPATSAVAEVPTEWAEAYYEARFGGTPLSPERLAALDTRLAELRQALG